MVEQLDAIDVWDCHGVLKNSRWGLGYGCKPDIASYGLKWVNVGYFTIPLPANYPALSDDVKKQVEKVCFEAVQRHGAINMSGLYDFYGDGVDGERLLKALNGQLKEANIDKIVNGVIQLLKRNPMHALLTWSSAWSMGCSDTCQGYHAKTYVYSDGENFYMFTIGCHHARMVGMWDIKPQKITEERLIEEIKGRVEHDNSEETTFEGEEDGYIDWLSEEILYAKIEYCKEHDTYYWADEACPECELQ